MNQETLQNVFKTLNSPNPENIAYQRDFLLVSLKSIGLCNNLT